MIGFSDVETIPEAAVSSVAALWHDAWHTAHDHLVPPYEKATRSPERFEARLRRERSSGRMVRRGARPVGLCLIDGDEVAQLFVAASARQAGIGRLLLADAENRLRQAGHETAWLTVVQGNEAACRFYERLGWRQEGAFAVDIQTPSGPAVLGLWRFEKTLAP